MRRIDLTCKLLSPIVAGVLLVHTASLLPSLEDNMAGGFVATVFVALWNLVSFFGELGLLVIVYRLLPALATKELRGSSEGREGDDEEGETKPPARRRGACPKLCKMLAKLAGPYKTLRNGWGIFWRQEINVVGFSMASIYLTVLGMSGVTTTYLLTQGVSSDFVGIFQGVGGVIGIGGTLAYPFIRGRVGTVRTGLFGISSQLALLSCCIVSAFISKGRSDSTDASDGYYSPACEDNNSTIIVPTSTIAPSLASIPDVFLSPSLSPSLFPSPLSSVTTTSPFTPSIILLLIGVTGARFGLWMFDLAVSQLIQEKVPTKERGVVSGVMNAMNSNMDMLHYVLVIVAPRPQDFRYLIVVSYLMVVLGYVLYLVYVRRARGHIFHFQQLIRWCTKYAVSDKRQEEASVNSLMNPSMDTIDDEDFL